MSYSESVNNFAIAGFAAIGLGVVVACGGAVAPSEPLPPAQSTALENDPASGGETDGLDRPRPAAGAKCAGGECTIDSCLAGFVDCDGDPTNACECPSDSCLPGKLCGKRVFVTSTVSNGNLGGLAGADSKCQERALAAVPTLPGTYKAWLSDDVASPSTRFKKAAIPYRLVSGTLIANDWIDLTDGTLTNPINLDEFGAAAPTNELCGVGEVSPWTWTSTEGTDLVASWGARVAGMNCMNWTDGIASHAELGSGNKATDWASWCNAPRGCNLLAPLFCFQQ